MSLSIRPLTPPASLTRLKARSIPSFIWRPFSLAAPDRFADMPNRISRSVTPRTAGPTGTAAVGSVAATAVAAAAAEKDGATTAGKLIDGELNTRARDIPAGQRRTDDRSDAACEIAHHVLVTSRCIPGANEQSTR